MKIKVRDYGPEMDREMQSLCDTLNALPGVYTVDSCGGHGKSRPVVFFFCTSLDSLAQIQRAVDPRYGGQKVQWTVRGTTTDTAQYGTTLLFLLDAERPYRTKRNSRHDYEPAYYYDTGLIIANIKLLHGTKWGRDACKGIYHDCPKRAWNDHSAERDRLKSEYEGKVRRSRKSKEGGAQ